MFEFRNHITSANLLFLPVAPSETRIVVGFDPVGQFIASRKNEGFQLHQLTGGQMTDADYGDVVA